MAVEHIGTATGMPADSITARVGRKIMSAVRIVQYARMMQALAEMSDENLKAVGITRADIPHYAHKCIYEDEA